MNGVQLTSAELYYLARTFEAPAVVGLDQARLFPADPAEAEAKLALGLQQLKDHGWLRPAEQPGRYNLHDGVMVAAAAVADPQVVILAARGSQAGAAMVNIYLAGQLLVEVTVSADELYHLALLPDLAMAAEHIGQLLELPAQAASVAWQPIQLDGGAEAADRAAAPLVQAGVPATQAQALATALAGQAPSGLVALLAVHHGQVGAGRRIEIYPGEGYAWFVWRPDPASAALLVQAGGRDVLAALVAELQRSLPVATPAG